MKPHPLTIAALLMGACNSSTCPTGQVAIEGICEVSRADASTARDAQVLVDSSTTLPDGRVPGDAQVSVGDGSVRDGSVPDSGADASADGSLQSDAGACAQSCSGDTPVCRASSGKCVQCTAGEHAACTGDTSVCNDSKGECVECNGAAECTDVTKSQCTSHACEPCTSDEHCEHLAATPVCDTSASECVECNGDGDCGDAAKSHCDTSTHACVACDDNSQCTHLGGQGVCDTGACVQCTALQESACSGNACTESTRTCSTTPRGNVHTCGACTADSDCFQGDHRCIPVQYQSAAHGNYCMKRLSTGCDRPYGAAPLSRASVSGASAENYCGIDEATTTCEVIKLLQAGATCASGNDSECGVPGALCKTVNGLVTKRCTYACSGSDECPSFANCGSTYCGSP